MAPATAWRGGRLLAALLLCLATGGLVLPSAAASSPRLPAAEQPSPGEILVILDVSGSMDRADGSGSTLIRSARRAVDSLVGSLPEGTRVGLRLYGHRYGGDDRARGCRDTEQVVPTGPLSRTGGQIRRAVRQAEPTGFTPIGRALAQAGGDFTGKGQRSVILVSDGEDTCGRPAPCEAARGLANQGVEVRVDTIGFFLQGNRKARNQLQCIARATQGRFVGASDAGELADRLEESSRRAIRRFRAEGTPVDGGPAAPRAAMLAPGRTYVDDVRPGEARWYSFPAGTGQEASVTLTEDGRTEYGCCLKVRLLDPDLDQLAFENGYNNDGTATSYRLASDDQGLESAGKHLIEVRLEDEDATGPVAYELSLEVTGRALEEGRPSESASPSAQESSTGPSATPSPSSEATTGAAEDAGAAQEESGSGPWVWLAVVLGVLVLAALGTVLVMLRRLRS